MPRDIYDDMARTNHPIGRRLRDSQVRSCTSVVLGGVSLTRNFEIDHQSKVQLKKYQTNNWKEV
jgi:hypothetical protein